MHYEVIDLAYSYIELYEQLSFCVKINKYASEKEITKEPVEFLSENICMKISNEAR